MHELLYFRDSDCVDLKKVCVSGDLPAPFQQGILVAASGVNGCETHSNFS